MLRFAQTAEAVSATSGKLGKIALVAEFFRSMSLEEASTAAIFFSGRPFAAYEQATLQVGGSLLWRVIAEISGKSEQYLSDLYRKHGDAGAVVAAAVPKRQGASLSLADVRDAFVEIAAARGPTAKANRLRQVLASAAPFEAKYVVKIINGDLRIGLKENLVEEAMARAFDAPVTTVQRANMLLGDIGETLRLAASGKLNEARLRLFHPIAFMLASPASSPEDALAYFENPSVEDKYDGIRAQAHIKPGQARLFSRTRDEITESFPELVPALAGFPQEAILDGEIVAWSLANVGNTGRARPFSELQRRLGRKKVSAQLMQQIPVAFLVFDILYANGELLLESPLRERQRELVSYFALLRTPVALQNRGQVSFAFEEPDPGTRDVILLAPASTAHTPEDLEQLFTAARARGNEGLMIKDPNSLYTPGRRGKSWLKMKRELATLDVVVTAVEYGHGKRIAVLSDYTFAVWDGDQLVNIGKAYSGLTDAEIADMTKWFLAHKLKEQGLRLDVQPQIILEVAFNNIMRSGRHASGFALRFPRILRLRPDKQPGDADTIQTVAEIFARQHSAGG
jgi:DNA ligase-1